MRSILFVLTFAFATLMICFPRVAVGEHQIQQISKTNWQQLAPDGKEADWIYGDYVLRNQHFVAVIAKPAKFRDANMTVRDVGGSLIDLTAEDGRNDQLSAYYPGGRLFEFDDNAMVESDGDEHRLTFVGRPIADYPELKGLRHRVSYIVRCGHPALLIQSQLENESDESIEVGVFDSVRADRDFKVSVEESLNAVLAGDYWWNRAYAVTASELVVSYDQQKRSELIHFREAGEPKRTLPAGEKFTYERSIWVADHTAGVLGQISKDKGQLHIEVHDADGPISGAKVLFRKIVDGRVAETEYAYARTDNSGTARFALPLGTYATSVSAIGRPDTEELRFELTESESRVKLVVPMQRAAYVSVEVKDEKGHPIPCKIEFDAEGVDEDPYFGPDTFVWEVHNLMYTEDGKIRRAVPPGKYRLLVSHGNEYDAVTEQIEAVRGNDVNVDVVLKRTVNTEGWISADFHSHSSPSGDNTSSQLGRVLNLLAEHIEFAPCTEHNRISTYEPHLERLDAVGKMATCSGIELTGGPLPVNHQNAFPLHHHPHTQDGGGPQTSIDPVEQIKRIESWDDNSVKVVQENHPDIPRIMCDADADGNPDDGYREMFDVMDVIEVHPPYLILSPPEKSNPDNVFGNQMVHWLQLLNLGYRIPGVVNTDSHYTFHGSGWLRNYIHSTTDDPAQLKIDNLVQATNAGNLVMSNGPFLNVTAKAVDSESAIPGDDLSAADGKVQLELRVECANWLDVNRVQILVNGRAPEELDFRQRDPNTKFRNGTVKFEETIPLELDSDAHLIVAVLGEGLGLGPVAGPDHAQDPPCAVSNPIFVDVDGNGFQANRDLLDIPLPAGIEDLPTPK